jgi:hypothetical protein
MAFTEEDIQLVNAYQNCFVTDSGKMVLADLKRVFKFDLSVIPIGDDSHIDVNRLLRNEGQRSVLIHILTQMAKDLNKPEPELKPKEPEERNYIE